MFWRDCPPPPPFSPSPPLNYRPPPAVEYIQSGAGPPWRRRLRQSRNSSSPVRPPLPPPLPPTPSPPPLPPVLPVQMARGRTALYTPSCLPPSLPSPHFYYKLCPGQEIATVKTPPLARRREAAAAAAVRVACQFIFPLLLLSTRKKSLGAQLSVG